MSEAYYKPRKELAINTMVREISSVLSDCEPSIYMYGSSVLNDFRLGWSDLDILVLTDRQITEEQAKTLVGLREAKFITMSKDEYANFVEDTIQLVVKQFAEKKLMY